MVLIVVIFAIVCAASGGFLGANFVSAKPPWAPFLPTNIATIAWTLTILFALAGVLFEAGIGLLVNMLWRPFQKR